MQKADFRLHYDQEGSLSTCHRIRENLSEIFSFFLTAGKFDVHNWFEVGGSGRKWAQMVHLV